MERHPKQLHVRMSDREMESAKGLARELGMTVSDLVRVLLQLPAEEVRGGARLVVVDRTTAARSYIALSPMRSPKRMKSSIIFSPASSP